METALDIFFVLAVVGLIVYLMTRGSGWHGLAKKYPERAPHIGQLRRCGTFQLMKLDSNQTFPMRFTGGIISVGVTSSALYIVAPSIVRFLFPTIQLPWAAIASAKPFEAPGWVQPVGEPVALLQVKVEYDPGFSGEFIELETTAPARGRGPPGARGSAAQDDPRRPHLGQCRASGLSHRLPVHACAARRSGLRASAAPWMNCWPGKRNRCSRSASRLRAPCSTPPPSI